MKQNQVKTNKIKTFALNFKAAPELLNHTEQLNMLSEIFKKQLYSKMKEKGYEPLDNMAKIIPCIDLNPDSENDTYRISVQGIRKIKEGTKDDS